MAEAKRLGEMLKKSDKLTVIGATTAPQAQLPRFRQVSGATFPILYGLSESTLDAYGIRYSPALVVLGPDGSVIGRTEGDIAKALDEG